MTTYLFFALLTLTALTGSGWLALALCSVGLVLIVETVTNAMCVRAK